MLGQQRAHISYLERTSDHVYVTHNTCIPRTARLVLISGFAIVASCTGYSSLSASVRRRSGGRERAGAEEEEERAPLSFSSLHARARAGRRVLSGNSGRASRRARVSRAATPPSPSRKLARNGHIARSGRCSSVRPTPVEHARTPRARTAPASARAARPSRRATSRARGSTWRALARRRRASSAHRASTPSTTSAAAWSTGVSAALSPRRRARPRARRRLHRAAEEANEPTARSRRPSPCAARAARARWRRARRRARRRSQPHLAPTWTARSRRARDARGVAPHRSSSASPITLIVETHTSGTTESAVAAREQPRSSVAGPRRRQRPSPAT